MGLFFTFKAKAEPVDTQSGRHYALIRVPRPTRRHVDMVEARRSKKFGPYANSDLFPGMLARALRDAGVGMVLETDRLPPNVRVCLGGFLAVVTVVLEE